MRIGLALPHYDFSLSDRVRVTAASVGEWAIRAEDLGFDSAWVSDHFVFSLARYGGPAAPSGSLEPLATIAALAVRTSRIRLGALVLAAPFRDPVMTAHLATTLAAVSGGRFELGLGAGWHAEDFEPFGYRFGDVGDRFGSLEEVREAIEPAVAAAGVRTWIGGKGGDRGLRLVARHGDGWNTAWRWRPDDYAVKVARLREFAADAGTSPHLSVGLYAVVGSDRADLERRWATMGAWMPGVTGDIEEWRHDALVGTVDECLERIDAFAGLGVEEIILAPATVPFAVPDPEMVTLIAEQLLPRVAGR